MDRSTETEDGDFDTRKHTGSSITRSKIVANCNLISHNQSLRFGVSVDDEHRHDGLDHSSLVGQPDGTLGLGANL